MRPDQRRHLGRRAAARRHQHTLRDWLLLLRNETGGGMFTVYATEDIIAETLYRLRRSRPASMIWSSSSSMIGSAPIRSTAHGQAQTRTTPTSTPQRSHPERTSHLPATAASPPSTLRDCHTRSRPLTASFSSWTTRHQRRVRAVTAAQLRYWLGKDGEADLPARLRDAGCPDFAERVRTHLHALET